MDALKASLDVGPTSVTIDAGKNTFQSYQSGVIDSTTCGTALNHAVTAVGYGYLNNDANQMYWIIRNSWGSSWGDAGYVKIKAVSGIGICGVQSYSYRPSVV